MRRITPALLAVAAALLLAACGPTSQLITAPSGSHHVASQSAGRAMTRRLPRVRAFFVESAERAAQLESQNGGPCGMLDAMPRAGSANEQAFVESYRRALKAHPDCPMVWKSVNGRRTSSVRSARDNGCYDWWTNDPNGTLGSYNETYGGGNHSGCSAGGGYSYGDYGGPVTIGANGGGGGVSPTPNPNPTPFNRAIVNAANAAYGTSDANRKPAGVPCNVACVYVVNSIIQSATGEQLCGDIFNTDQIKSCAQTALVSQATSKAGDLIIVDSTNGKLAHVGICLNDGCTKMNSNSSSHCTFTFTNTNFDYPGSPYTNGYITYWRMIS